MENIKTIIFDYDGTLYNSAKNYVDAFRSVYDEMVIDGVAKAQEFEDEEITKWLGYSAEAMWESFMPELPKEKQMYYSKKIGEFISERIRKKQAELYEGTLETLQYLKDRGYNLLYLSNCGPDYMNVQAECFGLHDYFSHMYCSGDYNYRPKYEIFNVIKEQYPGEYLVVGDRFHDIEIGKYHKVYTAGCAYGFGTREELQSADIIIDDIQELKNYL